MFCGHWVGTQGVFEGKAFPRVERPRMDAPNGYIYLSDYRIQLSGFSFVFHRVYYQCVTMVTNPASVGFTSHTFLGHERRLRRE
jgi:hypothetical protein